MENILIITGASRGLGLGIAKVYHKKGYRVISISRSYKKKLYELEQYKCDLSKSETIKGTIKEIFSHLDSEQTKKITLVNNAGNLGAVNTLEHIEASDISYTIGVNLIAPMILNAEFINQTKGWKCSKQIINISSGAAINPYESWVMYCSSKAGLDMMTKVLAKEQKDVKNGASVVSIYPGIVDTDMQQQARNTPKENFKSVQRFIDFYELGELATPKQVGKIIYKLDNNGKLKNGQILDVRNI